MSNAKHDQNHVPTLTGVSNADGTTPVPIYADPTTHRLLIDSASGSGDVVGPASSTDNAIVRFDGTTGKLIQNSTVTISDGGGIVDTIANNANVDALTITQSDTTNNKNGVVLAGATTGNLLKVTPTGATPVTDAGGGAIYLDNTSNTGLGLNIYSNQASAAGFGSLLRIHADNTSFAQALMHLVQDGTAGAAANIRMDGPAPQIEFVETDQAGTDGSGKFELGVNGDIFYVQGRAADNSGFIETFSVDRQANGGGIRLWGSTSGYTKLVPNAVAGTTILTIPAATDTLVARATTDTLTNKRITKRVLALSANSAAPAINTDNYDVVHITSQTAAINLSTNLTGTPVDGDTLRISITGTGAVGITMGASFEASTVSLPTTTVSTNRLDIGCVWNTETTKWRVVATA